MSTQPSLLNLPMHQGEWPIDGISSAGAGIQDERDQRWRASYQVDMRKTRMTRAERIAVQHETLNLLIKYIKDRPDTAVWTHGFAHIIDGCARFWITRNNDASTVRDGGRVIQ